MAVPSDRNDIETRRIHSTTHKIAAPFLNLNDIAFRTMYCLSFFDHLLQIERRGRERLESISADRSDRTML